MTKRNRQKGLNNKRVATKTLKPFPQELNKLFLEALAMFQKGQLTLAKELFLNILAKRPNHPESNHCLAICLYALGEQVLCEKYFRKAAETKPNELKYVIDLAIYLNKRRKYKDAEVVFEQAVLLAPDSPKPLFYLGICCSKQGKYAKAINHFEQVLKVSPDDSDVMLSMANAYVGLCDGTKAEYYFTKVKALNPKHFLCLSNMLFNSNYLAEYSPEKLYQKHIQEAKSYPPIDLEFKAHWDGQRKIRIGYISADFNKHSVAYFLWPVIRHHNKDKFELYCYFTGDTVDPVTHSFRQRADHWHNCADINNQSLAELMRSHKLDILIDLSGHSTGNRLAVLSRRVAPVQVNWLGYPHSTGVEAMDYRIVDEITDPTPIADDLSNEKLIRLESGFLCYKGDAEVAYQKSPPHLKNGYITFGSFNNLAKVNDFVIESWAQILTSTPSSKIIIKANQLAEKSNRSRIHAKFEELGVSANRVELMSRVPDSIDHLSVYNQIDIALDTFPYNGTTTTCEALWMGVPTITFLGDRHASRVSASILKHAELDQFVADDLAGYKELAITLAENPEPLDALRPIMREKLNLSSLCNAEQFTANFETALSQLVTINCGVKLGLS